MKYIFLDTETTGLDPKACSIHEFYGEICAVSNGQLVTLAEEHLKAVPRPDALLEVDAMAMSGLTIEQMVEEPGRISEGGMYSTLIATLGRFVKKYDRADKLTIVGYNVAFDDEFLRALWKRQGDTYYGSWFDWPVMDVAILSKWMLGQDWTNLKNRKLGDIAERLGVSVDKEALHGAKYDCMLAKQIFLKLTTMRGVSV